MDTNCTCGPCRDRRQVLAWAEGKGERPSDDSLRFWLKRFALDAEHAMAQRTEARVAQAAAEHKLRFP